MNLTTILYIVQRLRSFLVETYSPNLRALQRILFIISSSFFLQKELQVLISGNDWYRFRRLSARTDIYQSIKSVDRPVDGENDRFRTIRSLGCTFDNDKPDRERLENLCAWQKAGHCAERESVGSCSFVVGDRGRSPSISADICNGKRVTCDLAAANFIPPILLRFSSNMGLSTFFFVMKTSSDE